MDKETAPLVGLAARRKILSAVMKVVEVIAPTLGPAGRSVLLPRTWNRGPRNADDGFMAAQNVILKDEYERLAADTFKESISLTNRLVGDGTTGTGVLAGDLIQRTFATLPSFDMELAVSKEKSLKTVREIRKELLDEKDKVIEEVKKRSKPVETLEDLEKVSLVSLGKEDEEIAKTVARVVWETGRDAQGKFVDNHIDVVEGYKGEIETEVTRGMRFASKVAHRAFLTDVGRFEMVAEDVPILLTNHKLDNPAELSSLLKNMKEGGITKLVLFAWDFSNQTIRFMIDAVQKGGWFIYPVKCASLRTELLEDLAVYIGANICDKDKGGKIRNMFARDLGFAEKLIVRDTENKDEATLKGGRGEKDFPLEGGKNPIALRQEVLRAQFEGAKNELLKVQLEKRIANLASAVGVIRVGASSSAEALYLKLKIEDASFACKAALAEGIVRGGGLCLKEIAEERPESLLTESLKAPYAQIQKNAGGNFAIGEDIIDPAKVVRLIVEHGVSVATTLLTTHAIVPEIREKSPAEGYEEIAQAIRMYTNAFARNHGMIKENEDYQDMLMNHRFEEAIATDHD